MQQDSDVAALLHARISGYVLGSDEQLVSFAPHDPLSEGVLCPDALADYRVHDGAGFVADDHRQPRRLVDEVEEAAGKLLQILIQEWSPGGNVPREGDDPTDRK